MNAGTPGAAPTTATCSSTDSTAATALDTLTRDRLLDVLETVPQSYWPPLLKNVVVAFAPDGPKGERKAPWP